MVFEHFSLHINDTKREKKKKFSLKKKEVKQLIFKMKIETLGCIVRFGVF